MYIDSKKTWDPWRLRDNSYTINARFYGDKFISTAAVSASKLAGEEIICELLLQLISTGVDQMQCHMAADLHRRTSDEMSYCSWSINVTANWSSGAHLADANVNLLSNNNINIIATGCCRCPTNLFYTKNTTAVEFSKSTSFLALQLFTHVRSLLYYLKIIQTVNEINK